MQIGFIVSLLFAILVAFFAVMNSDPVAIRLFWWKVEFSQAIVIFGSAALGAIIVTFLGIFRQIKLSLKIRDLQSKVKKLEFEKEELSTELSGIKEEPSQQSIEHEFVEKTTMDGIESKNNEEVK